MDLAARIEMMHQGGWDEALMVVGPLLIIGLLIAVARKQRPPDGADRDDGDPDDGDPDDDGDGAPGSDTQGSDIQGSDTQGSAAGGGQGLYYGEPSGGAGDASGSSR
jgi:hypothetical protein